MSLRRLILPLFAALPLALACAGNRDAARDRSAEVHGRWLPAFVFGLFGDPSLDVRDLCASGVADEVALGSNAGTISVSILTLGIYTPRKVWVRCAPGAP